jgi:hypothetical protein
VAESATPTQGRWRGRGREQPHDPARCADGGLVCLTVGCGGGVWPQAATVAACRVEPGLRLTTTVVVSQLAERQWPDADSFIWAKPRARLTT